MIFHSGYSAIVPAKQGPALSLFAAIGMPDYLYSGTRTFPASIMTFRSRIQWSLFLPILFLLLGSGLLLAFLGTWFVLAINLTASLFILQLITATDYTVLEDRLQIRSGMLFRLTIPLKDIRTVKPTTSILSAPAASIKGRLEIIYGKGSQVIVSPADADGFLRALQSGNPKISVPSQSTSVKS